MRSIAIGRVIGLLLATIGIGLAIHCAREALCMNAEFHQWMTDRPMETTVDFSQPGEITAPFRQTCGTSHGEAIYFQCDLDEESRQNPKELFEDLSASLVITDCDGEEIDIESRDINKNTVHYSNGRIILTGMAPFPKGDYVATIRVDSGVVALADKQQSVYAQYHICGLEQMPAMVVAAFALGAGIIGLVSAVAVLPGLLRSGIWRNVSEGCVQSPESPEQRP